MLYNIAFVVISLVKLEHGILNLLCSCQFLLAYPADFAL